MKKLLVLALLIFTTGAAAEQDVKINKQPINPVLYQANILPLLEDLESMLNIDLKGEKPVIYVASLEEVAKVYCPDNEKCSIAAVTDRNTGEIYITLGLIINNLGAASVVFHELVHWVQVKQGWWKEDSDCVRWAKQEMHAYKMQSLWLVSNGGKPFQIENLIAQCK